MFAKDIMTTEIVSVPIHTTVKDAMTMLVDMEIGGLMVTNDDQEILGVISAKDLMVAYDFLHKITAPIEDYLNRNVIAVAEDTPIEEVSRILFSENIHRVPVLTEKKVVGVISRGDILKYILQQNKD